ncbi:MAG: glycosyltransferase [Thermoanaerobaculales bacterium]|jgi:glycosyltransferase involved in cell wall biosynthesis|nr:glycosyltransferase [Thermoanaerobaculales bacterium]
MRIVAFVTYYRPHWTGLTRHAQLVAEGMAARGHEVTVMTTRHRPDLPHEERLDGVRVVRLPVIGRVSRGMVAPSVAWRGPAEVRWADVVHLHSPQAEAAWVALWARALGRPVVMTHHADLVLPDGPGNRVLETAVHANLLLAARLSSLVVAYSEDYARHSRLLRRVLRRTRAIPPPVEIPAPTPEGVARLRDELGLAGRTAILCCGRFVEEKGQDVLVAAIPRLVERLGEVVVLFAGEFDTIAYERFYHRLRPEIERHGERVRFLGLINDRRRLADLYAAVDVLALPSRTECFALVQPEAMLCGTPVVASDIPGGRVPVSESGMGRLFRPGDADDLAAALAEVVGHRGRFCRPAAEIRARYDLGRSLDLYEEAFAELTGRRGRAP